MVIPGHEEQSYTTEWSYDTWNRLLSMTYPDEEKVEYSYNAGGLLRSMSGKKSNRPYGYVKQLGYDKFEQRVFLSYGNGTKTAYSYEEDRRRLSGMEAKTAAGRMMMDNTYQYDKVNNILSLKNTAPVPTSNLMGGSSEYTYSYDDLYRLTKAEGSFKGSSEGHRYSLSMSYNSVGGITEKMQLHERKGAASEDAWRKQKKTSYSQSYSYSKEQPHAAIHIGEQSYSYDANGNSTGWTHDVSGQKRSIVWDEENRIRTIMDNGAAYHYIYDASGERVLKGHSSGQSIFINAAQKGGSGGMGNYTIYVNPYLVLKSGGYTKHYYIEGQRIVSKLGSSMDLYNKGRKAGEDKVDYRGKAGKLQESIVKNLKFLGVDGAILTAGKSGKIPPGQLNGNGIGNSTAETSQYFYHPDHLGSTSYVTDASGEVYQHLEYFAFGETFVEEHSNTNKIPFLYNGKKLDEETGLYYYGARYYDSRTSLWLGVDPLAEKYPGWSSYNYCLGNPINMIDPDGRIAWPLRGNSAANKSDLKNGGYGLTNTVVRTSTYREIRNVGTSPHKGIDYRASIGTPFYSLGDGTVADIGTTKSGIKFITIEYAGGDKIRFLHLNSVSEGIEKGSKVYEGQIIGETGNTGKYKSKGKYVNYPPHLHMDGVDKNGKSIDPEGKNYGKYTNEELFNDYGGDYKKLPTYPGNKQEASKNKNEFTLPTYFAEPDATRVVTPSVQLNKCNNNE